MMGNISEWATTAGGNNTGSPPDFPVEGQAPNTLNDNMREFMAAVARWYSDLNGSMESGGTGNAYTLTTANSYQALEDQSMLVFRVDHANTGAVTLKVDSLLAKDLVKRDGEPLEEGDLLGSEVVAVTYNSSDDRYSIVGAIGVTELDAAKITSGTLGRSRLDGHYDIDVDSVNGFTITFEDGVLNIDTV